MRPSPIIPSCIAGLPYPSRPLFQSLFQRRSERGQALLDTIGEMHAQGSAPAVGEHVEVAARLRRLDHAERIFGARHRQIGRIAAGDLQEDATVRATLVGLSGRVQETWAEAEAGG